MSIGKSLIQDQGVPRSHGTHSPLMNIMQPQFKEEQDALKERFWALLIYKQRVTV